MQKIGRRRVDTLPLVENPADDDGQEFGDIPLGSLGTHYFADLAPAQPSRGVGVGAALSVKPSCR